MKYLNAYRWLMSYINGQAFTFYEGEPGGGGGDEPGGGGGGGEGAPEWLSNIPEKYRMGEGGTPITDPNEAVSKLINGYNELNTTFSKGKDGMRAEIEAELNAKGREGVPEAPTGYALPDTKLGEVSMFPADEPVIQEWMQKAHQQGMTQDQFGLMLSGIESVYMDIAETQKAELQALGENGKDRLQRLDFAFGKILPQEQHAALLNDVTSANAVQALEKILSMVKDGVPPSGDDHIPGRLTKDDIKEAMKDPRYRKDKAYTDRIGKMWEQFHAQGGG